MWDLGEDHVLVCSMVSKKGFDKRQHHSNIVVLTESLDVDEIVPVHICEEEYHLRLLAAISET